MIDGNKFDLFSEDLSNSGSSLFQQHTQISSVSNAIGYDPSRLANFLGHHTINNNSAQKLETIYENAPISKQNVRVQKRIFYENLNHFSIYLVFISNIIKSSLGIIFIKLLQI